MYALIKVSQQTSGDEIWITFFKIKKIYLIYFFKFSQYVDRIFSFYDLNLYYIIDTEIIKSNNIGTVCTRDGQNIYIYFILFKLMQRKANGKKTLT